MAMTSFTRRIVMQLAMAAGGTAAFPAMSLSQDGKTLKVRTNRDIQVLDPGWMVGGVEIWTQVACLTQLANYAPGDKWGWVPGPMVEEISQRDDLNIHFKLKPGYQWSGGYGEVTAEDVKYSIERMRHSEWKDKFVVVDHVEILGAHEGLLVLDKPFAPLWLTALGDGTGSIVCKKAIEATGTEVDSSQADGTKVKRYDATFPAQCGPYIVANWLPKQRIELRANPEWIGEKPSIEAIDIIIVEDEKTAELAFEAGELDLTVISVDSASRYKTAPPEGSTYFEVAGLRWTWMGMNTEHPKLTDKRVREAICYAVDVDAILLASYGGNAPRSYGVVPPGLIGSRTSSKYQNRDVEKAKALVAEAGAEGLALDIKIINNQAQNSAASIVQANLAEIGINLEIIPLESGVWWDLGLESRGDAWKDLQLYIARYGDSPDPSQMYQWYVSGQVGIWNWERWKNPEFDELFDKGLAETDTAKREEIYQRMAEILDDTAAYVYITHEPIPHLIRTNHNPIIHLDSTYDFARFTWA
ncbi:MAG: ABC transporter substrate-binding protein [Alphaproteobacteria bacterium]